MKPFTFRCSLSAFCKGYHVTEDMVEQFRLLPLKDENGRIIGTVLDVNVLKDYIEFITVPDSAAKEKFQKLIDGTKSNNVSMSIVTGD